jgi:nucleoside-diphosphate-sugar epimerase
VIAVSGKDVGIEYVEGPVGVRARNFSKARSRALDWEARVGLREGIARTYAWIEAQVKAWKAGGRLANDRNAS